MIIIKRNKQSTYNVTDYIYIDGKLKSSQSNLAINNKFGAKKFKLRSGKVVEVEKWESITD